MTARRAYLLLHFSVLIWGFTAILGKWLTLPALSLVFYRQLLASLLLALGYRSAVLTSAWRAPLAVGALVAAHWFLFFASIKLSGVALSVICLSTSGLFAALLQWPVLGRQPSALDLGAGILAVIGVALLVGGQDQVTPLHLLVGISSAFFSALFATLNGRLVQTHSAAQISFWELTGGTACSAAALLLWPAQWLPPWRLSAADAGLLVLLSGLCTVVPWIWSTEVLRRLSPFVVVLAVNLEPVYSMALAYWLFPDSERLAPSFYAGTACILGLLALHGWLSSRTAGDQPEAGPA